MEALKTNAEMELYNKCGAEVGDIIQIIISLSITGELLNVIYGGFGGIFYLKVQIRNENTERVLWWWLTEPILDTLSVIRKG